MAHLKNQKKARVAETVRKREICVLSQRGSVDGTFDRVLVGPGRLWWSLDFILRSVRSCWRKGAFFRNVALHKCNLSHHQIKGDKNLT